MKSVCFKINYGPSCKFKTVKEFFEFFGEDIRSAALFDVFDERDILKDRNMKMENELNDLYAAYGLGSWSDPEEEE